MAGKMLAYIALCLHFWPVLSGPAFRPELEQDLIERQASTTAPTPSGTPLVDFQVYAPVLTPQGTQDEYGCVYTQTLMVHEFASSYGQPFVGQYTPPPCSFNRVTMNLTVTIAGRQFDRLAEMYLGDVEVFRTSTAEPTQSGISWTYIKEMQHFNALWSVPQKIIFELDNIYDSTYTGIFYTELTATFFTVPDSPPTADMILPISARMSSVNAASVFTVPGDNASVSYVLPKNVNRAVVALQACGQSTEEFWYTNAFTSEENTFEATNGALYGGSPWREVQLLIDGQLAGVSWPFPIIFTGGIVPGFWRPIVGIDAFDLRLHEIDITPWLGLLLDGNSHTFEIRVASLNDDGHGNAVIVETPGSYWLVDGVIFLFQDKAGSVTTGTKPVVNAPPPKFKLTSNVVTTGGVNQSLFYDISASRQISVSSTIKTANGRQQASWSQTLSYNNNDAITNEGLTQDTVQITNGRDVSSSGYINTYSYPITVNSTFSVDAAGDVSINGTLNRGLQFDVYGPSVVPSGIQNFNIKGASKTDPSGQRGYHDIDIQQNFPSFSGALLSTSQQATAEYYSAQVGSYSFGSMDQDFSFSGAESESGGSSYELYSRHVKAVNSTVVQDQQILAGQSYNIPQGNPGRAVVVQEGTGFSVKSILGRGPGKTKAQLSSGS